MRTMKYAGKLNMDSFYKWLNPEGMEIEQHYDRKRLLAEFVEVDAETYDYFLGMLPPMHFTGSGFAICEASTADIRLAFFQFQGRYFAAHISDFERPYRMTDTRASLVDNLPRVA
jgi:hypothetical protein